MSPHLRSMLEDAADDSGRPAMLDVEGIRAAGRRAVWRRRGIAGGLGASVTAVVATVAVVVGTGGIGQTDLSLSAAQLEAAGLSASSAPLIAAIEAAGYEVDLDLGPSGSGEAASGGDSSDEESASGTSVPMTRDGTTGALVLTEFSSLDAFHGYADNPARPEASKADDSSCAMPPPVSEELGFAWGMCDAESLDGGEIWSIEGSGTGVEAIGSTVVLEDGSGFSVTMANTPIDGRWYREGMAAPTETPLAALPLTSAELAAVMAEIAAAGGSLLSSEPAPDAAGSDFCDGEVLAELSDADGRTELIDHLGQLWVCSYVPGTDDPLDVTLASELPVYDAPLEPWQFSGGLFSSCGIGPCAEGMLIAVGSVPDGATRITFEPFNGSVTEATIVDGIYFARVAPAIFETGLLAPTIVRVYDAAGALLLEGDATARDAADGPPDGTPPTTDPVDPTAPVVDPAATHPGPAEVPTFETECPDGEVLAELADALGGVALVELAGTLYACLPGVNPAEDADAFALTGYDWPTGQPLEASRFGLGYVTMCTDPCTQDLWSGVGPVPPDVARITFETPDGEVGDAQIASGYWIFRHPLPIGAVNDPPLVTVRLYDAAGALLLEGDTRGDDGR